MENLKEIRLWVQSELKSSVNFWLANGMDKVNGGIYTCLDRFGHVYSKDKSVWMQGRSAWTFAELCRIYGRRPEWEAASGSCIEFLNKYCVNNNAGGRLYFAVTGDGKPLRQRRYWHSEDFYIIGHAAYGALTGKKEMLDLARKYYDFVYQLNHGLIEDPVGIPPKVEPSTRKTQNLGKKMMCLNSSAVLEIADPENTKLYRERAREAANEIIKYHFKPELGCTLENVGSEGEFLSDSADTRVINPGHGIECSWFMLDFAIRDNDEACKEAAKKIFWQAVEKGWDEPYGGIIYFVDALGTPVECYEHDMKHWWAQNELAIASLKFFAETKDERYLSWFIKIIEWSREHMSDPLFGEWFGYLRRDGVPTVGELKGTTYKGPFHLPRMLMIVDTILGELGF